MILWQAHTMPAKAVQVSIDLDLLQRIDADPEAREKGRSAFVRPAVSSYLGAKQRKAIGLAICAAYADAADASETEVSELLDPQAWPGD